MMQRSPVTNLELRPGVTLTEVLMSLMIMAIGVTSVIALFPIATLRTAQATKLTNAAIVKYNLESVLQVRPELIFDPDGDGDIREHFANRGVRNYIVDPVGFFSIFESSAGAQNTFGHDISNAPSSIPRFDGGIFANASPAITADPTDPNALRALRIMASELAGLGDGWETLYEFVPSGLVPASSPGGVPDGSGASAVGVQIPADVIPTVADLALLPTSANMNVPIADPEWTRILVFSSDETFSQSFPLLGTLTAGPPFSAIWSEAELSADFNGDGYIESRTLPREFMVDTDADGTPDTYRVSKVLIQTRRSVDFSWMLTVRRTADGGARSIDAVIRFGDEPKFDSEMAYPIIGASNNTTIRVNGVPAAGLAPPVRPALNRGGFVFDADAARWHRIRDYEEISQDVYQITLEKPALSFAGPAIFIPGIVEVYPLGSASMPEKFVRGF